MPDLSDAEVICAWMCDKPEMPLDPDVPVDGAWLNPWWLLTTTGYEAGDEPVIVPRTLDLGALYDVEQKLMQGHHGIELDRVYNAGPGYEFYLWHLTAAQKVESLARVIRGLKCYRPIAWNSEGSGYEYR